MEPISSPRPATVEQLAEAFMDRMRRGERPLISEYTEQFPELADEIRDVFPALAVLEEFGPAPSKSLGRVPPAPALERLGEYRILREIGRGGMGVVYEAIQESLGRHVALKVLPFQFASDAVSRERFHREARVAARLHHSNIVPVFDVGEHSGIHYYAMQFIHGLSLDDVMDELRRVHVPPRSSPLDRGIGSKNAPGLPDARGDATRQVGDSASRKAEISRSVAGSLLTDCFEQIPVDPPGEVSVHDSVLGDGPRLSGNAAHDYSENPGLSEGLRGQGALSALSGSRQHYYRSVARVGLQVADALSYVHAQGLLHRDIKPANLLLDTRGVVWITDLGLAREEASSLTRSGDVVGTLRYMAPERFRGQAYPSSDVYSLGLTLYELLTLRAAFDQSDRGQLAHQITSAEPLRPRRIDPHLPRDLETIVLKAIDKEPLRRYQTAEQFSADLRSFLEDRPIRARRTNVLERSWRWCRRNRSLASLAGSVAALLVVMAIGASLAALLFRDQAAQLGHQAEALRSERVLATQRLYEALFAQGQASRWSGRAGRRFQSLTALTEAAALAPQLGLGHTELLELRNEAIACMALTDLRVAQPAHKTPPNSKPLAFSHDLTRYVWSDANGNLSVRQMADHEEVAWLPGSGVRGHLAQFSPNDRYLAAHFDHPGPPFFRLWDLERSEHDRPVFELTGNWTPFDFSADSTRLAIGHKDGSIQIIDPATNTVVKQLTAPPASHHIRFHPNGRQLAISTNDSPHVRILDLETGNVLATLSHPKAVLATAWESQGRLLACASSDYRLHVWNVETRREQAVLVGHQAEVVQVAFSHASDLLASFSWDGTTRLWDAWTGQHWITVSGELRQFSRDDKVLAFIGNSGAVLPEVGLWEVVTEGEFRTLNEPKTASKGPHHISLSPDGRLMLSTGPDGVRLWDLAIAREITALVGSSETATRDATAVFLPGGSALMTSGSSGVWRWPLRRTPEISGQVTIGPPHRVLAIEGARRVCVDQGGQKAGVVHGNHAHVVTLDQHSKMVRVGDHPGMTHIAMSPDGQWIATGTWHGLGVKLWNAESGALVSDLFPDAFSANVAFSPDGRWLVAAAMETYRFWEVGTWRHSHDVPGAFPFAMAFVPDGTMMALAHTAHAVRLIDPATGEHMATLESPSPQPMTWLGFTPDGSRLAVACGSHVIQLWDLRRVREQLSLMGLDWSQAPYAPRSGADAESIEVLVDPGELRPLTQLERNVVRLESLSQRIAANPDDANAQNELAWLYATGPMTVRDPEKARMLVERAIALRPGMWQYFNTLGVVYYRLGEWDKAIEALEQAGKLNGNGLTAFDLFFLAMSHHKKGDGNRSSDFFQRAVEWIDAQRDLAANWAEELKTFRAEAEDLLNQRVPATSVP